jgi:hypothetical protein
MRTGTTKRLCWKSVPVEMQTKNDSARGAAGKIETHTQASATHDGWSQGKKVQAANGLSLLFIWRM